jgi:hypothetical protein
VQRVNLVVRLSHRARGWRFLGSAQAGWTGTHANGHGGIDPKEPKVSNVRSIIVSVTVLAAFLLVLAAPFRWF